MFCDNVCMTRTLRPHHLRAWRKYRNKTLVQVAEELHVGRIQLGRIEKGEQPYNQELLERLADIYACDVPDLLMRDPTEPDNIWSLWERAKPVERRQIVDVATALIRTGTDG